jgi:hypothetical protein
VSTPDEVIQQRLADGLNVIGAPDPAVFGDPVGAAAPPADFDLSKAQPTVADVDALRARLEAMEAAQAAAAPPVVPDAPVDRTPSLSGSVASDVREAIQSLHERIEALEKLAGL